MTKINEEKKSFFTKPAVIIVCALFIGLTNFLGGLSTATSAKLTNAVNSAVDIGMDEHR